MLASLIEPKTKGTTQTIFDFGSLVVDVVQDGEYGVASWERNLGRSHRFEVVDDAGLRLFFGVRLGHTCVPCAIGILHEEPTLSNLCYVFEGFHLQTKGK